ncbi:hypothetical protein KSP39_PZI006024 [Platanthera zijinensis]|uniref:DUF4218 domain-containing protein n=1 Tax=Platanthera zijinensis TaxID=2320716 RepID=A0AAP0BU46_9ASPA
MGLRSELRPIEKDDHYIMPQACYSLTLVERRAICNFLENLKVPDGYSSNIKRCINAKEGKISRMKAHDCHVFVLDQLAPAFRGIVRKEVYDPVVELSVFFKDLCSKVLSIEVLDKLEKNIAITLCKLERIFPPSFFTIMMHLPIHLAQEARVAGPVQYRWMYPIERYVY